MYRIGLFSKMTKVTIKALRFYEAEGLLIPDYIDSESGYRYYSSSQLPLAYRIVSLRQCGFPVAQIRQIIAGKNIAKLFVEQRSKLEEEVVETARRLTSVNHYLDSVANAENTSYDIVLKELPSVLVYSCRMVVDSYDDYFTVIPKIGEEISRANPDLCCVDDPPYCFIMYHDGEYRDQEIDIEFCEAVASRGKETERISFKEIPAVKQAACVMHKGPYSALSYAYGALFRWIEDNKLIMAGNPRESYIDGIWNKSHSENEWLTELQIPVTTG
ncbi:MAG: MerR family transcriptional regulator [Spirochaetes bacterium]|nr:MerR family transcriptional regulator [Spirochaetota bacterium]MBN2769473.1 MerR family transcriptional regulator [Spirochaetota bacterium]